LRGYDRLTMLEFTVGTNLNNESFLKVIKSVSNKNYITHLMFHNNDITDPNCEYIGDNFPNLQWLGFRNNPIGPNMSVKGLGKCKNLQNLWLGKEQTRTSYKDMEYLPDSLKLYNFLPFERNKLDAYVPVPEQTTPVQITNPQQPNPKPGPIPPTNQSNNSSSDTKPNQGQNPQGQSSQNSNPNPNQSSSNQTGGSKETTQQTANGDETDIRLPLKDMPSEYWENIEVSKGWRQYQDKAKELPAGIFVQNDYGKTTSQQAFESLQSIVGPESMDAVVKWKDLKQWLKNQKVQEILNQQLSQRPTPEAFSQLKNDYDQLTTKVTGLSEQNNTLRNEKTRLDTVLSQRDKDNADLQSKLGNKDKLIATLNITITSLKSRIKELEKNRVLIPQVEVDNNKG
jgi:peptide methionine sulfoxide reductase MsrA